MSQSLIVAIILIGMIIVFFGGWIPMAAAALAVPMLLQITGILSFEEAWAGFSSDTVVSLVVLFILGGILNQTTFLSDLRVIVTKMGDGKQRKAQGASGSNAHEYGFFDFRLSGQRHGHYASDRGSSCKRYGTASQKYY